METHTSVHKKPLHCLLFQYLEWWLAFGKQPEIFVIWKSEFLYFLCFVTFTKYICIYIYCSVKKWIICFIYVLCVLFVFFVLAPCAVRNLQDLARIYIRRTLRNFINDEMQAKGIPQRAPPKRKRKRVKQRINTYVFVGNQLIPQPLDSEEEPNALGPCAFLHHSFGPHVSQRGFSCLAV